MRKMRQAKSAAAKQKKQRKAAIDPINELKLSLVVDRKYTIEDYAPAIQQRAFGMIGSIRQLIATYNGMLEASRGLSAANQRAIQASAATLEAQIDQRIDAMNEFLEREEEAYQRRAKPKKKKATRLQKAERALKKAQSKKYNKSLNAEVDELKSARRSKAMRAAWKRRKAKENAKRSKSASNSRSKAVQKNSRAVKQKRAA